MKVYILQPNLFDKTVADLMTDDGLTLTTVTVNLPIIEAELAKIERNYKERTRHQRLFLEVKATIKTYKNDLKKQGLLPKKARKGKQKP